jgi:hypothetical protein
MRKRHDFARLVIGIPGPDGSMHTRHWTIPASSAEDLASQPGEPDSEMVASRDGVANVTRAMDRVAGVVRTDRGPR